MYSEGISISSRSIHKYCYVYLGREPMQRSLLGDTSVTHNNTAGVATQPFPT
jgi:hypothetical protein